MKLIGIDYGTKRIGFAVSDAAETIAFPRGVVDGTDTALRYLKKLITEEHAAGVVIGVPIRHGGTEGELAGAIRAFANDITAQYAVPVHFQNELLSTKAILQGAVRQGRVDAASAALILQSYLDAR